MSRRDQDAIHRLVSPLGNATAIPYTRDIYGCNFQILPPISQQLDLHPIVEPALYQRRINMEAFGQRVTTTPIRMCKPWTLVKPPIKGVVCMSSARVDTFPNRTANPQLYVRAPLGSLRFLNVPVRVDSTHTNRVFFVRFDWEVTFAGVCQALTPQNVDITCTRNRQDVDCSSMLLAGTKVKVACKQNYRQEYFVNYAEIECNQNGQWNHPLFKCLPGTSLIRNYLFDMLHAEF